MALLESVPNVSEGRDPAVIEAVADAFAERGRVLDIHSDPEHHRSVYTIVADEDELASALLAGIARAAELIDLREHVGIHPRVGAADVVPIVPLAAAQMPRAHAVALELGEQVGAELGLPVFLYGESADGVRPAFFRRGGPAELQRRIESGELRPSFGPSTLDPRAGAVLIGARPLLIAFNIELRTGGSSGCAGDCGCSSRVQRRHARRPGTRPAAPVEWEGAGVDQRDRHRASATGRGRRARAGGCRRARGGGRGRASWSVCLPEDAVADPALLGLEALDDAHVLERRIAQG